jgi:hypothetical protein
MKEDILSFIWKYQYFDKHDLLTWQGEKLQIIRPGTPNSNAGPDFFNARIKVGGTEWVGPVEIHVKSSDWESHNHHLDPSYDQVVLHVVWTNNRQVISNNSGEIPVLELKTRVDPKLLLSRFSCHQNNTTIPCEPYLPKVSAATYKTMLDRALSSRIKRKAQGVLKLLKLLNFDWDQVTYVLLGRNFGYKINAIPFELLVASVPLNIVRKIRFNRFQLEALYFGQAGFLQKVTGDPYYLNLQKEYYYLSKKYGLASRTLKKEMWNYLRLRPSNFPVIRIAQFVSLMHQECFRFSDIRETVCVSNIRKIIARPGAYWDKHYDFGKVRKNGTSTLGKASLENLIINTLVPVLAGYAMHSAQKSYLRQAIELIKQLPPEQNRMVSNWKNWGFKVSSAYDSQGLIELNNSYCKSHNCLDCSIGQRVLTRSK